MANITLNTIIKEVKTGNIAKVVLTDDRAKTASIKFEDGTTKAYTMSTLKDKRRFEILGEEVEPEENMVSEEDLEAALMAKATKEETSRKPRITITYNGESKTPKEWAEEFGMDPKKIRLALRKGKTPEEIFGGKNK